MTRRPPTDGIALGALVARETTQGTFSGEMGGLTLGLSGLGVMFGQVSGTTQQRSQRAQALRPPEKPTRTGWAIVFPLLLVLVLIFCIQGLMDPAVPPLAAAPATLGDQMDALRPLFGGILVLFILGLIAIAVVKSSDHTAEAQILEPQFQARRTVYHRLRYVENDHVVFDPTTGREVPAERADVLSLIYTLAEPAYATRSVSVQSR